MHEIVHIAFGLFLLKFLGNPWLLFPAVFVSHFVLDFIPHHKCSRRKFVETVIIDILLSIVFLFFYLLFGAGECSLWIISGVIFFAILPDIFLLLDLLWKIKIFKPFMLDFHKKIQNEYPWGWIIEMLFLIILTILIYG